MKTREFDRSNCSQSRRFRNDQRARRLLRPLRRTSRSPRIVPKRDDPMNRVVNRMAALVVAACAWIAPGVAPAQGSAPVRCDPEPWSYGAVIDRKLPRGSFRIGPQRFCAEVAEERRVPVGPIGIVIDPLGRHAPGPVAPIPRRPPPPSRR